MCCILSFGSGFQIFHSLLFLTDYITTSVGLTIDDISHLPTYLLQTPHISSLWSKSPTTYQLSISQDCHNNIISHTNNINTKSLHILDITLTTHHRNQATPTASDKSIPINITPNPPSLGNVLLHNPRPRLRLRKGRHRPDIRKALFGSQVQRDRNIRELSGWGIE